MDSDRVDYIERLISGVREEIDKSVTYFQGEACYPAMWVDASILCDVIEEEVLPDLKK